MVWASLAAYFKCHSDFGVVADPHRHHVHARAFFAGHTELVDLDAVGLGGEQPRAIVGGDLDEVLLRRIETQGLRHDPIAAARRGRLRLGRH